MVRLRWPFVTALVVLVVGLCGWLIVPGVQHAWQRRAVEAKMRPLRPGIDLMMRLPVDAGTSVCRTPDEVRATGLMCWRSARAPVAATTDLLAALHSVGATNVVAKCVSAGKLGPRCTVTAHLAAVEYRAYVGPQLQSRIGRTVLVGAEIVGGMAALGMIPSYLPPGTPIAVPT